MSCHTSSFNIDFSKVSVAKFRLYLWRTHGLVLPSLPPNCFLRPFTVWDKEHPTNSTLLLNLRPFSPWLGEGEVQHGPLQLREEFLHRDLPYPDDPTLSYSDQLAAGQKWKEYAMKKILISLYRAKGLRPEERSAPPPPPRGRGESRRRFADTVRCPGQLFDRKLWGVQEESEEELFVRAREGKMEKKVVTVISRNWEEKEEEEGEKGKKQKKRERRRPSLRRRVLLSNAKKLLN